MKNLLIILITVLLSASTMAAQEGNTMEELFGNMTSGKWHIEAEWNKSGMPFVQDVVYEWSLDKKIIKAKTYGTVNMETEEFGLRNEGIRAYDPAKGKVGFWEFDVYGNVVTGNVIKENGTLHYEYEQEINGNKTLFRDGWTRVDDNTYNFTVNMMKEGEWLTLLEGEFVRTEE